MKTKRKQELKSEVDKWIENINVDKWGINFDDLKIAIGKDKKKQVELLLIKIGYAQKDYANLDIIDKEEAIKLIKESFNDVTKEKK